MHLATSLAVGSATVLLGACGVEAPAPTRHTGARAPAGPALTRRAVSRELGTGVRQGLTELAIMDQQSDDASALTPDLPSGVLRDVRCVNGGVARWRCTVSWRDAGGAAQATRYAAHADRGRCLVAVARPTRPTRYDSTIRATSEDPLNTILSMRHGC